MMNFLQSAQQNIGNLVMAGSVYSHATYPPVAAKDNNELGIFSVTKYIMRLQIFPLP